MGVFKVLMWKHYTVRKRRLFQTMIEFLSPVSLVFVLFLLKDSMMRKAGYVKLRSQEERSEVTRYSMDSPIKIPRIIFTPDSVVTRILATEVIANLNDPSLENQQNETENNLSRFTATYADRNINTSFITNSGIVINTHLNTSKVLNSNYLQEYDAIVEFKDVNGDKLPEMLKYIIRVKQSHRSFVPHLRSYERFGNLDMPLLRLQWAIDYTFLKLKTDRLVLPKWNVYFEELPRVPHLRSRENVKKKLQYVNTVFLLLPYVSFLGPLLPFIFLMIRLLEERSTGIQELVKMVGVTPTMLGITQFLNSLPSVLIFSIGSSALLKMTDEPMVPNTKFEILFIGFFLHFISMVAMAYACSYIVREAQYTVSLAMFVYIGMWIPIRTFEQDGKNDMVLFLLGLLPHCPTYWYMNEIHTAEVYFFGTGITFDNWDKNFNIWQSGGTNGTVRFSFIMQLVQIFLFFLLSWYMERVRPGKYGIALPLNFPFTRDYWRTSHKIPEKFEDSPVDPAYTKYFEDPPTNMVAGIKISNVSKIFGSGSKEFHALKNVNLDVYKGEITVLLGHNGAGKTTLISIITGMYRPSSGKVFVSGMDSVTQQQEVRQHLGFCPQHNLFFPDLTVREHFMFFTLIKGGTFERAQREAESLLRQLDLAKKADSKTCELSGGMLRRLQLGCALCGNASVLILDEPTSGLDVKARRELWDMLLALRGERTLLLTTHFMEEADVLGDRLAALHGGQLRCHATPMFLKRAVGSGFRLQIITASLPDEAKITSVILQSAPRATLKEKTMNSILYDLPAGTNMLGVFNTLESKTQHLSIESLSVGIATLEEVFIKLCCDVEDELKLEDTADEVPVPITYITGSQLILRQLAALFKRQLDFTFSKINGFVILQIIMPMVLCVTITVLFNNAERAANLETSLSLDLYSDVNSKPMKALYRLNSNASSGANNTIDIMKSAYPAYEFRSIDDFSQEKNSASCTCGTLDHEMYHEDFVLGADINGSQATVYYNPTEPLSASIGLNFLSNILAIDSIERANGRTINMGLSDKFQLTQSQPEPFKLHIPKDRMNCVLFATFNIFIIMSTAVNDVTLPCRERLAVARHTHVMAGCPPVLYWLVTFVYHMCCYELFCVSAALIAAAYRDKDKTIDDKDTLIAYAIALTLCGMDFYAFAYFVSYYFNDRGAGMLLIGFTVIFGFLAPILMMALDDLNESDTSKPTFNRIMNVIGIFLPAHMFTDAISKMTEISRFNSFCKYNFDLCSFNKLPYFTEGFDRQRCCSEGSKTDGPFSHYAFTKYAMGEALFVISIQFICFATIVLLLEYGYFNRWWNNINRKRAATYPPVLFNDVNVIEEKDYVKKQIETLNTNSNTNINALLMQEVYKTYFKLFAEPTYALRDTNFSVKKGECLGILGANGAGKTTTFKVISCEESATHGHIFVHNHFLSVNRTQYMQNLGYCPQFFGLDDFRTGENNLRLLLELSGFSDADVKRETNAWLDVVAMMKYRSRVVSGYSGGMVRRLATAASLCRGAPLTLLDEPTSGVDTAARRLVWKALRRGVRGERAVLLTSNNMEEIELLCQRVMVLKSGEMCVLGTPPSLKEKFAPGNAVIVKLRAAVVQGPNGKQRVEALKANLEQKFSCILKDQHLTTLYYRVTEQLGYSVMFTKMEEIQKEFADLVEDFSVSDTTLEDVFLSLS